MRTLLTCLLGSLPLAADELVLYETTPIETTLGDPALPEAHTVWAEAIAGASESIELAHFYASNQEGGRLEVLVQALEQAAARGVRVRFLASETFYGTYPDTLERLAAREGVELRRYDLEPRTGGTLHAKALYVDGRRAYVGSQNFDWRALEHILELGVCVEHPAVVEAWLDLFELDWHLAGGGAREEAPAARRSADAFPARVESEAWGPVLLTPVASPPALLTDPQLWDLPHLIEWIDGAQERVRVQLLTYRMTDREGGYFAELEGALRRAAARGVRVELLCADWCKRRGTIEGLQALQCLPGIEVRLASLPAWSGGHIPFARVIHAKLMVVDGARAWIGTSNWERGYFHRDRNLGLLLEGAGVGAQLDAWFERTWGSEYAETVDPCRQYEVPRIGE